MSVDVLPPNTGHIAGYNHLSVNDTRPRHIDSRTRRKLADPNNRVNMVHFDPNYIIYDSGTDTTYLRGRLLGKVCRCSIFYILDITTSTPTPHPPSPYVPLILYILALFLLYIKYFQYLSPILSIFLKMYLHFVFHQFVYLLKYYIRLCLYMSSNMYPLFTAKPVYKGHST